MMSASNLRQVGVALHNYHHDHHHFPPAIHRSADGRPLLSWRVLLLPYLGHELLYDEFNLDEPWYSEYNRKLLSKMPSVYKPLGDVAVPENHTFLQLFVGPAAVFEETGVPATLGNLTTARGAANTLLAADSAFAVPWTKPEDIPFDKESGPGPLGGQFPGDFRLYALLKGERRTRPVTNLLFADCQIRMSHLNMNAKFIKTAIQWENSETVQFED